MSCEEDTWALGMHRAILESLGCDSNMVDMVAGYLDAAVMRQSARLPFGHSSVRMALGDCLDFLEHDERGTAALNQYGRWNDAGRRFYQARNGRAFPTMFPDHDYLTQVAALFGPVDVFRMGNSELYFW